MKLTVSQRMLSMYLLTILPVFEAELWENWLKVATSHLGLTVNDAYSRFPDVDAFLANKADAFASMNKGKSKTSMQPVVAQDGIPTGCIRYMGNLDEFGYGPHRRMYERFVGPIPANFQVDHICNNTWCQNPMHMVMASASENQRRAFLMIRCPRGHEMTDDNRLLIGGCKTCQRQVAKTRKERTEAGEVIPRGRRTSDTVCLKGHEMTDDNVYTRKDGHRQCMTCRNDYRKAHKAKRKQQDHALAA